MGEVVVYGKVTPALEAEVEVRLYHVEADGKERLEAGASTPLRKGGTFRTTIVSGARGWRPGTMRVEDYLSRIRESRPDRAPVDRS
jgi:hypothetical protein